MDKKDPLKNLDPQIAANLGGRPVVKTDLNPKKPKMPEGRGGTGKGTPPPFPLVAQKDIHNYTEAGPKKPEEVFGYHQAGKFDPELNELALKEVAEQRGITVEELLADKNLGKKLARKVEPAMEDKTVVANVSEYKKQIEQETMTKEGTADELELLDLQRQEIELKIKRAKLQSQAPQAPQIQLPPMMKEEPLKKPITNPIIQRMREKLSIERIKPASVEIEGIKFELLPPPSSMYAWVMNRLGEASPLGKDGVKIALQQATAAVSIMTIEGQAAAIVLGLALEVEVPDPYYPPQVIRELQAQALYEMLQGNPTMEHLFRFNPDMGQKIYNAFQISFRDLDLTSSLDPSLRHYTCPVPDCAEDYDLRLEKGTTVFCKIHGVPMDDRGLSKEVKSLPLL
jgi:ribosomal protein S25